MLERKIMSKLLDWKDKSRNKCLVINGARQVGKTFIVEEFAKINFDSYVVLNFIENSDLKEIFEGSLSSLEIISSIGLFFRDFRLMEGNTLIFIDEIQECPNAITALKFLAKDQRIRVIASGSILGINYKNPETLKSYPVGYVEYIDMHSLDFEEFLWALGIDKSLIGKVKNYFINREKVPNAINSKLLEYLKMYMVVGGMPEVVDNFILNMDYSLADKIQRNIYRDYIADIARYSNPDIKIKAEKCYKSISYQLSKENHKFQYSAVEPKGTKRKFENSIDWLINANLVMPVRNVGFIEYPLKSHSIDDNLRLYPTDIGLLICTYDYSLKKSIIKDQSLEDVPQDIVLKTAKGGLYEALIADMLIKSGKDDMFFYRNEQGTVEMEFLIENSEGVIPIEVKAGRKKSKSLSNILKKEDIKYGIKLSFQNVGYKDKKLTLPLYMAMWL